MHNQNTPYYIYKQEPVVTENNRIIFLKNAKYDVNPHFTEIISCF